MGIKTTDGVRRMTVFKKCLAAALLGALILVGCNKLPNSEPDAKLTSGQAAPSAATIALDLSSGNYGKAAKGAQVAIDADPQNPELHLLLARAQARLQNVGDAIKALQVSFDTGFHDPRGALNNPDFDGIRANPIFASFVSRFQNKQVLRSDKYMTRPASSITAGDVSIIDSRDGHSRIRAGDIELED